jgi:outer membrane protein insertion porin family
MRRTSLWLACVVLLSVTVSVGAVEFPVAVSEVAVQGNEEIRRREILEVVLFGAGDEITDQDLRTASQAIHDLGWFSEVSWDREAIEDGRVVFVVKENPVIEKIVITGNDHRRSYSLFNVKLLDAPLVSTIRLRQILWGQDIRRRKVLNLPALTAALEEILEEYERRGYILVSIGEVDPSAVLRIQIVEYEYAGSVINGLRTVPESVIQEFLQIPVGEPIHLPALQAAAMRLRGSIFVSDLEVEPQSGIDRTKVWLRWTITEQQLIDEPVGFSSVSIEGNSAYTEEVLMGLLGDIPVDAIGNYALLEFVRGVHDRYMQGGYSLVRLRILGVADDVLRLRVDEGLIGSITVEGTSSTREYVVERNINLSVGEVFNRRDLLVSYQQLTALGYFDAVDLVPAWEDDTVDVLITLTEKKNLGSFGGSMAVDPRTGSLFGELKLNQKNLFGTGQDVELSYSRGLVGVEDQRPSTWNLGYSTVAFFPGFDRVGLDLYQTSKEIEVEEEDLVHVTLGASLSFDYPLAAYSSLGISFQHEEERVGRGGEWTPTDVLSLSLAYDDTDHPVFPTEGNRRRLTLEKAGGFSPGLKYSKGDLTWIHFVPTALSLVPTDMAQAIALRVKAGWADEGLPATRQLELGGSMSVRGVSGAPVRQYLLTNVEYRLQLIEGLYAHGFLDAGLDLGSVRVDGLLSTMGLELGIDAAGVLVRLTAAWVMGEDSSWVPVFELGFGQMF